MLYRRASGCDDGPMFTGLVQAVGSVAATIPDGHGLRLEIDPCGWPHRSQLGDSIAVAGCCLTVAADPGERLVFQAVPETLSKTTLGGLRVGARVNLERSLAAGDPIGGHFVQGHVDGIGRVTSVLQGADWRLRIAPGAEISPFLAPKGAICVEGVSLTVAAVNPAEGWFEVALIPVTLEKTTLGALKADDLVNLEADILAKTVVHYIRHFALNGGRGNSR